MKAEERKEIETNSLILAVQRLRKKMSGRTLYYVIGTVVLVVAGILLYRYFTSESQRARDAVLQQLVDADTPEKLKQGMEDHRGTILGSQFKMQLARHLLSNEGLPKLGTQRSTDRATAANSLQQARDYFLELTKELKEKEEPTLMQEAWLSAAKAEEALIGLPVTEGASDYRGNIDQAIEYYEKAGSIFADSDFSKRYKERAEMLKANKDKVVADYRAIYKPREFAFPPFPDKNDPFGPGFPPSGPKSGIPPPPPAPTPSVEPKKAPEPKPGEPKIEVPPIPSPPAEPKKTPEVKPVDPAKVDPKAK